MHYNTEYHPSLKLYDIDEQWTLLIDPDNVFWTLLSKKGDLDSAIKKKALPLYERVKSKLDKQMQEFRFKSNLMAIYINPTDRCNANCPYCYIPPFIRKNGREMDGKQLAYVLNNVVKYFTNSKKNSDTKPVIVFHASEPLLVKDLLFNAISKFDNKLHFGLQTNALLLEKKDVAFLKKHRVGIGISLDSSDHVVNNRQRISVKGDGNFKKAVEAIEWFAGYSGLNVITTITKFNVSHLSELVRFLHKRKVSCILLNPVRATQKGTEGLRPDQVALTEYFIDAVEEAIRLSISSRNGIIIGNFSNIILGIVAPTARRLMCDITPCGGGRCFLTITASGDMIPCGEFIGFRKFYGGNIFDTSIGEAMWSEPFKEIRARIVERIHECDICIFRNICGAPCPAEVYSTNKDMNTLSPYCEFYKELIRYAFKLIAEDKVKYLFRKEAFKNLQYEYKVGVL